MWTGLTKKLKDFADDIAVPRYDDEEEEEDSNSPFHAEAAPPHRWLEEGVRSRGEVETASSLRQSYSGSASTLHHDRGEAPDRPNPATNMMDERIASVLEEAQSQLEQKEAEVVRLKATLAHTQKELRDVRASLEGVRETAMTEERNRSTNHISQLQASLAAAQAKYEELSLSTTLQATNNSDESKTSPLVSEAPTNRDAALLAMEEQFAEKHEQLESALRKERQVAAERLSEVMQQLQQCQEAKERAEHNMMRHQQEVTQLSAQVNGHVATIESLRAELVHAQAAAEATEAPLAKPESVSENPSKAAPPAIDVERLHQEWESKMKAAVLTARSDTETLVAEHYSHTVELLQKELEDSSRAVQDSRREQDQLQNLLKESQQDHKEATRKLQESTRRLTELQRELQHANDSLAAARQKKEAENEAIHADQKESEEELRQLREVVSQLHDVMAQALEHADIPLSAHPRTLAVSALVDLMTTEFTRAVSSLRSAADTEQAWEHTYDEAKHVNEALNRRLAEGWEQIGQLRESLSMKEVAEKEMRQRVDQSAHDVQALQYQLTEKVAELETLREERQNWAVQVEALSTAEAGQLDEVSSLRAELDELKTQLQRRDDELVNAYQSTENLQLALESLKETKHQEVLQCTAGLEAEVDDLRRQLEQKSDVDREFARQTEALRVAHAEELARKNFELSSLHQKLLDLRQALEKAARQLNGDTVIDKEVVSHLLVNYIHALVGDKPETEEILKLLSGQLGWNESLMEKVGLIPGPSNPRKMSVSKPTARGKLFAWATRRAVSQPSSAAAEGGQAGKSGSSGATADTGPSLAALWVDFLMKESERGSVGGKSEVATHAQPAADAPQQSPPESK